MSTTDDNDTFTELNAGSGGDIMDESLVTQADGVQQAKQPRIELSLAVEGVPAPRQPRVGEGHPLPTTDIAVLDVLRTIAEELAEIRLLLSTTIG